MKLLFIVIITIFSVVNIYDISSVETEKYTEQVVKGESISNEDDYIKYHIDSENKNTEGISIDKELAMYNKGVTPLVIDGITVANKEYSLPSGYIEDKKLRDEAIDAFNEIQKDAKAQGLTITIRSAYRSYYDQEKLYNYYVSKDGYEKANTYSAIPGNSEHQLGIAFDFTNGIDKSIGTWFDDTPQARWLYENAYKYGFILRYPKGKEHITGYMHESWHYRYVGTKHSYNFKMNDLTLEEYLGLYTKEAI